MPLRILEVMGARYLTRRDHRQPSPSKFMLYQMENFAEYGTGGYSQGFTFMAWHALSPRVCFWVLFANSVNEIDFLSVVGPGSRSSKLEQKAVNGDTSHGLPISCASR
ncbi:hypothetical protein MLD38_033333 [Melastoma candidum]|uniref:Uncharacterized protein n=1 Tax=Melastoma candidum TaxID=119954 RepID=A0ACB9M6Z7_9MYRT|nr:hypothetical protein MLD38_033333 [Melastoma candidum]